MVDPDGPLDTDPLLSELSAQWEAEQREAAMHQEAPAAEIDFSGPWVEPAPDSATGPQDELPSVTTTALAASTASTADVDAVPLPDNGERPDPQRTSTEVASRTADAVARAKRAPVPPRTVSRRGTRPQATTPPADEPSTATTEITVEHIVGETSQQPSTSAAGGRGQTTTPRRQRRHVATRPSAAADHPIRARFVAPDATVFDADWPPLAGGPTAAASNRQPRFVEGPPPATYSATRLPARFPSPPDDTFRPYVAVYEGSPGAMADWGDTA